MKKQVNFDFIIMQFLSRLSVKKASQYIYYRTFHKKLNLQSPQTFNEWLMWLKINSYTNNALITQCADKYLVRNYITECGCDELLLPLYGVWEHAQQISLHSLPDAFVLKCNHGCGYNIICPDKNQLNWQLAQKKLNKWMKTDFWLRYAEVNYRDIPKRIIAEKYICSKDGTAPTDYKFYCFHGHAKYVMVCCERDFGKPKFYFFDRNWELQRINPDGLVAPKDFSLPKPQNLSVMFSYADRLSIPFPFVRVDLYDIETEVKFSELTFTPGAALDSARLPQADTLFCSLLTQNMKHIKQRGNNL